CPLTQSRFMSARCFATLRFADAVIWHSRPPRAFWSQCNRARHDTRRRASSPPFRVARSRRLLASLHRQPRFQEGSPPRGRGRGHVLFHGGWTTNSGWNRGPLVLPCRPQSTAHRGGNPTSKRGARLRPIVPVLASQGVRSGDARSRTCPRRSRPRLL